VIRGLPQAQANESRSTNQPFGIVIFTE
jgi:hypothetical protein